MWMSDHRCRQASVGLDPLARLGHLGQASVLAMFVLLVGLTPASAQYSRRECLSLSHELKAQRRLQQRVTLMQMAKAG